ncbi:flippase [Psychrobacter sp. AOP22-C1-C5]|uniref:flippase n=1 Tax=Psychrobacter sp. AOP22-C1-C5 TaxID=3457716 RepID=UPI00403584AA
MWNRLLLLKAQLLGHEGIKRYGANTAWLMGEKVLRMFMGLFVVIWVARYLGPEQFGLLSYAQSFVFLFTAIATLGLDSIVVRELVKNNAQRNVLLGTAFVLKLVGSICILPLLWFGVQFTSNDSYTNLIIFIIASGTIFQSFNVIDFYYQSSVLSKYVAFANTITLAISSIVKIVLILNQASLLTFAIVGVFDAIVLSLGLIYFYWQKTHHSLRDWRFDKVVAKRLLRDSWPLLIGGLCFVTFSNIDIIMLKQFTSEKQVGLYSAAYRLTNLWYFLPGLLLSSLAPALINVKNDPINYDSRLGLVTSFLFWIAFTIALLTTIFSKYIVSLTYGIQYKGAANIIVILIWVNVFIYLNSSWNYSKIIQGKEYSILYFHSLTAILNIIFNIILIPKYGAYGASVSIIIALLITMLLFSTFDLSMRKIIKIIFTLEFIQNAKKYL